MIIGGNLNDNSKIVVLDSNNNTIYTGNKNSGHFTADRFGETINWSNPTNAVSGTVLAISNAGETYGYNKVNFLNASDLPPTPWTETFTGPDTQYPTGHMWTRNHVAPYSGLLNNKLRITPTNPTYHTPYIKSDFLLWGNFDIQVDLNVVSGPATNGWYFFLQVKFEPGVQSATDNYYMVKRRYVSAHGFSTLSCLEGTTTGDGTQINSTLTDTKLRIQRINNTLYSYYWSGSAWAAIDNKLFDTANQGGHAPVSVSIGGNTNTGYPAVSADFDNFTINASHISYRYVESFNGYSDGPPDSNFFMDTSGSAGIVSNKLRLATTSSISNSRTTFKYPLKGNLDVLTFFNMVAEPSSGNWYSVFMIWTGVNDYAMIRRQYNGTTQSIVGASCINGSTTSNTITTSSSGYFRIKRSASDLTLLYSAAGNTWNAFHTRSSFSTGDAYIIFNSYYVSGTPSVTTDYDDLKIINKPFNDLKVKFQIDSVA